MLLRLFNFLMNLGLRNGMILVTPSITISLSYFLLAILVFPDDIYGLILTTITSTQNDINCRTFWGRNQSYYF